MCSDSSRTLCVEAAPLAPPTTIERGRWESIKTARIYLTAASSVLQQLAFTPAQRWRYERLADVLMLAILLRASSPSQNGCRNPDCQGGMRGGESRFGFGRPHHDIRGSSGR